MKKTSLVIMAAGIGSRFGKGIKQLEPVGPNGEIIMDYSIYDALQAGFNKVVFIIRRDLEEEFRAVIGSRIEKQTEVEYAFQELEDLPAGFVCPADRVKPWGTGQAVLAAGRLLNEPFVVINADDYYGKEAFVKVHEYLIEERVSRESSRKLDICMAGFILGNTLSDYGEVTRGICRVDKEDKLLGVEETRNIRKVPGGACAVQPDGTQKALDAKAMVSMNMWGLTPEFVQELERGFEEFLSQCGPGDLKKEYLLPDIVDRLIGSQRAEVSVLKTKDIWFGVTYQEDKYVVRKAFEDLIRRGIYPEKLC